jgi:23S rRNA pseudouridine2605 synthase
MTPKAETTHVLMFHKPLELLCTHQDELGRETVYDRLLPQLPPSLRRLDWHAVGRLDANTTGLLLFTNDGALLHQVTQPKTKLPKTYRVLAKGLLDEPTLQRLRDGVDLTGGLGRSAPAKVTLEEHQKATSWVTVRIHEGKNRQVRRMFLAVDSQVIRLHRTHVGSLALDVEPGAWRALTNAEIERTLHFVPRIIR